MTVESTQQLGPWEVHEFICVTVCLGLQNQDGWWVDRQSSGASRWGYKG